MNPGPSSPEFPPPIPLVILTGYLGAGKTSLLNHLLALPSLRGRKLALIINEFGTLGIDGLKVESGAQAKFELNRGSLFCICIKTEFIKTLTAIAEEVQPDLVLVEATGVADPCDIEQFLEVPTLAGRFRVQASVCVVDAEGFTRVAAFMQAARRQVAWSDGLAINKTDLVTPSDLGVLRQVLEGLNPRAPQVEMMHGRLPEAFLLALVHERRPAPAAERPPDDLVSVSLQTDRLVDRAAFMEAIGVLGGHLLRLKGTVRFPDGRAFVEVVNGRVTEGVPSAGSEATAFVAIGWQVSRDTLGAAFRRTWKQATIGVLSGVLTVLPNLLAMAKGLEVSNIADRRHLFVDYSLIDRMDGVALRLHAPVSGGVVIQIDKPWEGPANFGMSVIDVGDRLLMYYRGWSLKDAADQNGVGCVAESRDGGTTWSKPVLNLVRKPDWPDNNIIATNDGEPRFAFPCAPWVDARPGVPAGERIKMVQSEPLSGERHTAMRDPQGPKRLVFWASGDGFSFRKLDPQPDLVSDLRNCFDGGNTMFWSEVEQQYVLYYRWYDDEWGRGRRSMARTTSKDLMTWTPSAPMTYGDTPREQFYVNNTQPYFRAPHIYIAPAARFMEGRQALTEAQAATIGIERSGPHVYFKDCSDAVLLTSRAGSTVYDRAFMEAFIRPGPGAGNWASRSNYPLTGILPCGSDEAMLFVTRRYMQDSWHIERLRLRLDGFASVTAPWAGGELLTKQLIFAGKELELNYRTSAAGGIRVEIQDAEGKPIPGYALAECPEIIGDEILRMVAWKQGSDIGRLAGKTVRLRFVMKDADLFSFRFQGRRNE